MEISYNSRTRDINANGLNKSQLMEAILIYLQTCYNEMNQEATKLCDLSEKEALSEVEEQRLETLIAECEKYRYIISCTEMEFSLMNQ